MTRGFFVSNPTISQRDKANLLRQLQSKHVYLFGRMVDVIGYQPAFKDDEVIHVSFFVGKLSLAHFFWIASQAIKKTVSF